MAWTTSVQSSAFTFEEPGWLPRMRRPHFLQGLAGLAQEAEEQATSPSTRPQREVTLYSKEPPPPPDTTIPSPPIDEDDSFDTSGEAPAAPDPDVVVLPYSKEEKRDWIPWAVGGLAAIGIGWVVMRRRRR